LRHGRMVKSAFTFYRGAALTMAADLRRRRPLNPGPVLRGRPPVQLRRLRHPERRIIFSINDLDETLRRRGMGPQAPGRELRRGLPDNGLSEAVARTRR